VVPGELPSQAVRPKAARCHTPDLCSLTTGGFRFIEEWAVPAGQTVEEQLTTPIVLKPLGAGQDWCLGSFAVGDTGGGFFVGYNGYVVSGTFSSPTTHVAPGAAGPTR
jgi:hypothetical protein